MTERLPAGTPLNTLEPSVQPDYIKGALQAFRTGGGLGFAARVILSVAAVYAVLIAIGTPLYLRYLSEFIATAETTPEDVDVIGIFRFIGWALLFSLLFIVPIAMGAAAVHRRVLFEEEYPGVPLRFGRDERNLLLTYFGIYGLFLLFLLVFVLAVALVGGILGGIGYVVAGEGGAGIAVIVILLGYIGLLVGMVWFGVRFAPAGAATILAGRPVIWSARRISRKRFWQIFAIYAIAYVFNSVVSTVLMMVAFIPLGVGFFSMANDPAALENAANLPLVPILAFAIIYAVASTISLVWMTGVGGYVVRWWNHDRQKTNVFD